MKTPRDYQLWAINGNDRFPGVTPSLASHKSTLCVMATGLGKTLVISKVANGWTNGNVLCLAHRIELVDQMADSLADELGYRPAIEQGKRGIDPETMFASGQVVVGSIQTMISDHRIRKFAKNPFGLIIIDEAHRATSPSYIKLVDRYREMDPNLRVLGVTATPNRTDGTAMGLAFDSVAFEMGIVDGIAQGWLVPVDQKFALVEDLDLSKIPLVKNEHGELDYQASKMEALLTQEGPLHAMSRPVLDCTQNGEQAIIFAASVAHAHLWAAVLNHYRDGCAAAIDGSMLKGEGQPRTEIVRRYKEGALQFLLNFNIATEGFDAPNTTFVVMGRPTKSLLVYTQMLGRGTRPLSGILEGLLTPDLRIEAIRASSKVRAIVIDFVGNSNHQIGVTATDVLGGNYDVDVREAANHIIGSKGGADVQDALNKARASMLLEIEEEKRRPLRKIVQGVDIKYQLEDVDPFGGAQRQAPAPTARGGATDGQIAALVNLGIDQEAAAGFSRKQASAVINERRAKRCTDRQAKTLAKHGFDPADFNADQASSQIQAIANNGWTWNHGEAS